MKVTLRVKAATLTLIVILLASTHATGVHASLTTSHLTDEELLDIIQKLDYVAEMRWGDNNPMAGDWEIGLTTFPPYNVEDQDNFQWQSQATYSFALVYDGSAVFFTLDAKTVSFDPAQPACNDVFVRTRAINGKGVTDALVQVHDLVINGEPVLDVSTANGNLDGLDVLWIHGASLASGYTLSGKITMSWTGTPTQALHSRMASQIKIGCVPEPVGGVIHRVDEAAVLSRLLPVAVLSVALALTLSKKIVPFFSLSWVGGTARIRTGDHADPNRVS